MTYMLCRNRVADFLRWKSVFASHERAHQEAGLRLVSIWRGVEEPNNVFFLFEVASLDKARKFISNPRRLKREKLRVLSTASITLSKTLGDIKVKVTHSGLAQDPGARKDYSGGWPGVVGSSRNFWNPHF